MKTMIYTLMIVLWAGFSMIQAAPPGGGYNGWGQLSAVVIVKDCDNDPIVGIPVTFHAEINGTIDGSTVLLTGYTNDDGFVIFSQTLNYWGWEEDHYIRTTINDEVFTMLAENTESSTSYSIQAKHWVVNTSVKIKWDQTPWPNPVTLYGPKDIYGRFEVSHLSDWMVARGTWRFIIVNDLGQLIRTSWVNSGTICNGIFTLKVWDGLDSNGNVPPNGVYLVCPSLGYSYDPGFNWGELPRNGGFATQYEQVTIFRGR